MYAEARERENGIVKGVWVHGCVCVIELRKVFFLSTYYKGLVLPWPAESLQLFQEFTDMRWRRKLVSASRLGARKLFFK